VHELAGDDYQIKIDFLSKYCLVPGKHFIGEDGEVPWNTKTVLRVCFADRYEAAERLEDTIMEDYLSDQNEQRVNEYLHLMLANIHSEASKVCCF
jgi:hypothetical protein